MRSLKFSYLLTWLLLTLLLGLSLPLSASGLGTHGITGGTLGHLIAQNDWQAFLLGFASHALLDMMPHHDPVVGNYADIAFHVGFNLTGLYVIDRMYALEDRDSKILWGALGGMIPDLEHVFYAGECVGGYCPQKLYPSHNGTLPHRGKASFVTGYMNESAMSGLSVFLTLKW